MSRLDQTLDYEEFKEEKMDFKQEIESKEENIDDTIATLHTTLIATQTSNILASQALTEQKIVQDATKKESNENTMAYWVSASVARTLMRLQKIYDKTMAALKTNDCIENFEKEIMQSSVYQADEKFAQLQEGWAIVRRRFKEPPNHDLDTVTFMMPDEKKLGEFIQETRCFPLIDVFNLVWIALTDDSVYKEESAREDRLLTLANCMKEVSAHPQECHKGLRHSFVCALNGVYPDVLIIEDLNTWLALLIKEKLYAQIQRNIAQTNKKERAAISLMLLQWLLGDGTNLQKIPCFDETLSPNQTEAIPYLKALLSKTLKQYGVDPDDEAVKLAITDRLKQIHLVLAPTDSRSYQAIGAIGQAAETISSEPFKSCVTKWKNYLLAHPEDALVMDEKQLQLAHQLITLYQTWKKHEHWPEVAAWDFTECLNTIYTNNVDNLFKPLLDHAHTIADFNKKLNDLVKACTQSQIFENYFVLLKNAIDTENHKDFQALYTWFVRQTDPTTEASDTWLQKQFTPQLDQKSKSVVYMSPREINQIFLHALHTPRAEWTMLFTEKLNKILEWINNNFDNTWRQRNLQASSYPRELLQLLQRLSDVQPDEKQHTAMQDNRILPLSFEEYIYTTKIKRMIKNFPLFLQMKFFSRVRGEYLACLFTYSYNRQGESLYDLIQSVHNPVKMLILRRLPWETLKKIIETGAKDEENLKLLRIFSGPIQKELLERSTVNELKTWAANAEQLFKILSFLTPNNRTAFVNKVGIAFFTENLLCHFSSRITLFLLTKILPLLAEDLQESILQVSDIRRLIILINQEIKDSEHLTDPHFESRRLLAALPPKAQVKVIGLIDANTLIPLLTKSLGYDQHLLSRLSLPAQKQCIEIIAPFTRRNIPLNIKQFTTWLSILNKTMQPLYLKSLGAEQLKYIMRHSDGSRIEQDDNDTLSKMLQPLSRPSRALLLQMVGWDNLKMTSYPRINIQISEPTIRMSNEIKDTEEIKETKDDSTTALMIRYRNEIEQSVSLELSLPTDPEILSDFINFLQTELKSFKNTDGKVGLSPRAIYSLLVLKHTLFNVDDSPSPAWQALLIFLNDLRSSGITAHEIYHILYTQTDLMEFLIALTFCYFESQSKLVNPSIELLITLNREGVPKVDICDLIHRTLMVLETSRCFSVSIGPSLRLLRAHGLLHEKDVKWWWPQSLLTDPRDTNVTTEFKVALPANRELRAVDELIALIERECAAEQKLSVEIFQEIFTVDFVTHCFEASALSAKAFYYLVTHEVFPKPLYHQVTYQIQEDVYNYICTLSHDEDFEHICTPTHPLYQFFNQRTSSFFDTKGPWIEKAMLEMKKIDLRKWLAAQLQEEKNQKPGELTEEKRGEVLTDAEGLAALLKYLPDGPKTTITKKDKAMLCDDIIFCLPEEMQRYAIQKMQTEGHYLNRFFMKRTGIAGWYDDSAVWLAKAKAQAELFSRGDQSSSSDAITNEDNQQQSQQKNITAV